jgi:ABC-type lipoprotein export system ATPase subunit
VGPADVDVRGLRKSFGDLTPLAGLTFRVDPGELVAVTGPSGSGKSTLLNLVGALDTPDAGEILVGGEDVTQLRDPARYRTDVVGFVFQLHHLLPTLTAEENVQLPMLGRRDRVERARALLAQVGLAGRERSRPATLSGGERQRVAIARALANDPRLLLADEPTGALDADTGAQVVELLRATGTTVLLVTNDDAVAAKADRVIALATPRSGSAAAPATSGTRRP